MNTDHQKGQSTSTTSSKPRRRGKKPTVEVLRETSAAPAPHDVADPTLRTIMENNAKVLMLRANYEEKHQDMKEARAALEQARTDNEEYIAGLSSPMPLFDRDRN